MPTGPGVTGMILQANGLSQLAWVDPGQLGSGSTGPQGAIGYTGAQGHTGLIGASGYNGTTGLQGETGLRGITGVQGMTGSQGNTGSQGMTGSQGVTGLRGTTGIKGDMGNGWTGGLIMTIDGRGYPITTGYKGDIVVPLNMSLYRWDMFGDTGGSAAINIKRATYSSYPGATVMHLGGSAPSLSLAVKSQSTDLSSWSNKSASSAEVIRIEVSSCTGIHRLSLNLGYYAT